MTIQTFKVTIKNKREVPVCIRIEQAMTDGEAVLQAIRCMISEYDLINIDRMIIEVEIL